MIKFLKNKNYSIQNRKYHLSRMNEPAFSARHDAAYERAVTLFSTDLFSFLADQRSDIYDSVLKLLDIAINARINLPNKMKFGSEKDPITQYLLLLKDTIKAAHALVAHEVILFKEEKRLSSFIGPNLSSQIRSTDEIFTNSEFNICHCANDLIEMASSSINRYRERLQKTFNNEDLARYKKTLIEFTELYNTYGLTHTDKANSNTQKNKNQ
jgi:uncharacterized protein YaaR (DUF327 family)